MALNYRREKQNKNNQLIENLLANLPDVITYFVQVNEVTKSDNTLLSYVRDLSQFLKYLKENTELISVDDFSLIDVEFFNSITIDIVKGYERHLAKVYNLSNTSIKRHLSSIASLYKYLIAYQGFTTNPMLNYSYPKAETHGITALTSDQTKQLLSGVLSNSKKLIEQKTGKLDADGNHIVEQIPVDLTPAEALIKEKNVLRDYAIITLFLGTGLRISELVGIDLDDLNFEDNSVTVARKGKGMSLEKVHFGKEVANALKTYVDGMELPMDIVNKYPETFLSFCIYNAYKEDVLQIASSDFTRDDEEFLNDVAEVCRIIRNFGRSNYNPRNGEEALFLSSRGTRISVRTVELMIKDKVLAYLPDMKNKHKISPHKLRSTAATRLLSQTDDILLVSKQLGHASPTVTAKHYAQMQEEKAKKRLANLEITDW